MTPFLQNVINYNIKFIVKHLTVLAVICFILTVLVFIGDYEESKRQILMRSDTKLPQPFVSWSNSL